MSSGLGVEQMASAPDASESRQASLHSSLQYNIGSALGYTEVSSAVALGK
jgi:hypothetical protein